MRPRLPLAWILAAALCLSQSTAATAAEQTFSLPAFSKVQSCLPFSLLIRPSAAGAAAAATNGAAAPPAAPYSLTVAAEEEAVASAVRHEVANGTLRLSLSAPLATLGCVSAIVELPGDALAEVGAVAALPGSPAVLSS